MCRGIGSSPIPPERGLHDPHRPARILDDVRLPRIERDGGHHASVRVTVGVSSCTERWGELARVRAVVLHTERDGPHADTAPPAVGRQHGIRNAVLAVFQIVRVATPANRQRVRLGNERGAASGPILACIEPLALERVGKDGHKDCSVAVAVAVAAWSFAVSSLQSWREVGVRNGLVDYSAVEVEVGAEATGELLAPLRGAAQDALTGSRAQIEPPRHVASLQDGRQRTRAPSLGQAEVLSVKSSVGEPIPEL
jgi:hypothetical protein